MKKKILFVFVIIAAIAVALCFSKRIMPKRQGIMVISYGINGDSDIVFKAKKKDLEKIKEGDKARITAENSSLKNLPCYKSYEHGSKDTCLIIQPMDGIITLRNAKEYADLFQKNKKATLVVTEQIKQEQKRTIANTLPISRAIKKSGTALTQPEDQGSRIPSLPVLGDETYLRISTNRKDYKDDETFANAREVALGKIKPAWLYRSSEIFLGNEHRTECVCRYAKAMDIKTIADLCYTEEYIKQYEEQERQEERTASGQKVQEYAKRMWDDGNIIFMSSNTPFERNKAIAESLVKMVEKPGPYLICGDAGLQMTGYACIVLEALCRETEDAITNDFMKSYSNYYGVQKDSPVWKQKKRDLLDPFLDELKGVYHGTKESNEKPLELEDGARLWLGRYGISKANIEKIKNAICH